MIEMKRERLGKRGRGREGESWEKEEVSKRQKGRGSDME